jgi:hypothetical protein
MVTEVFAPSSETKTFILSEAKNLNQRCAPKRRFFVFLTMTQREHDAMK